LIKSSETAILSIHSLAETTLNQKEHHEVNMIVKSEKPIESFHKQLLPEKTTHISHSFWKASFSIGIAITIFSVAPANLSRDLQPHLRVLLHVVLQYSQAVCPQPSVSRITSLAPCCWIAFSYKPSAENLKPLGLKAR